MAETKTSTPAKMTIEDVMKPHLLGAEKKRPAESIAAISEKIEKGKDPTPVSVLMRQAVPAGETRRVVTSGGRRFSVGADSATLESQSLEHA